MLQLHLRLELQRDSRHLLEFSNVSCSCNEIPRSCFHAGIDFFPISRALHCTKRVDGLSVFTRCEVRPFKTA